MMEPPGSLAAQSEPLGPVGRRESAASASLWLCKIRHKPGVVPSVWQKAAVLSPNAAVAQGPWHTGFAGC
jgi:hypothetical protein